MAGKFSVEAIFRAIDKVSMPVKRMDNAVGRFTDKTSSRLIKMGRSVDDVGRAFAGVGKRAFLGMGVAAGAAVVTGAKFEQSIVNASAKFGAGAEKGSAAFKALEAVAKKTGKETEFTAAQSAEALNFLAMAGFNAEQSIAALPGVVDLATAAQTELAEASNITTDILGAFSLAVKDGTQLGLNLARVNDVIAKTTTTSNTNMSELYEAMKQGAPVAKSAGVEIETVAAMLGKLANAGIKGSDAGTTLKNLFVTLANPIGDAAKLFDRLHVKIKDANGDFRDIFDILGDISKGIDDKGLGGAQKLAVIEELFGKIPLAGVNVLLGEGVDSLKEYRKGLLAAGGASAKMAAIMRDTTLAETKGLMSAIESVGIQFFEVNQGDINSLIKKTTSWVRSFKSSELKSFFTQMSDGVKDLGAIINVIIDPLKDLFKFGQDVRNALDQKSAGSKAAGVVEAVGNLGMNLTGMEKGGWTREMLSRNLSVDPAAPITPQRPTYNVDEQKATLTIENKSEQKATVTGKLGSKIDVMMSGAF